MNLMKILHKENFVDVSKVELYVVGDAHVVWTHEA